MLDPFYVWQDGENIHIDNVVMPLDIFDELCAMRLAQLGEAERERARHDAIQNWSGNFGCDALRKQEGLESAMDLALRGALELKAGEEY